MNRPSSAVRISNGTYMPAIGFGTYQIPPGGATRRAVASALEVGYRSVDTAAYYRNEADVAEAVRSSGIPRDDLFITTKLQNEDQGFDKALKAFEKSLNTLGRIDLYLVHWPVLEHRARSWKALERIYKDDRVGAIGVSNFMEPHLLELMADCEVVPMVEQVEMSPFLQQRGLRSLCANNGMVVQAYSPLTRGKRLKDTTVMSIANKHGRTSAQVMLRWSLQSQAVPLPKTTVRERMAENIDIFDFMLDEEDMTVLAGCDIGLHVSWNPTRAP